MATRWWPSWNAGASNSSVDSGCRMEGTVAAGRCRAKTGTINVRTMGVTERAEEIREIVVLATGSGLKDVPSAMRAVAAAGVRNGMETHDTLQVSLAQIAPVWLDRERTLDRIIARVEEAGGAGCQPESMRSIQMLLGFAPLIAMQFVMLGIALAVMVAIDLPLTLVAIAPMPFVFLVGVRLRNAIFPLSWVQQARQADVATIVDENIQGTRVVKAFAQERRQV